MPVLARTCMCVLPRLRMLLFAEIRDYFPVSSLLLTRSDFLRPLCIVPFLSTIFYYLISIIEDFVYLVPKHQNYPAKTLHSESVVSFLFTIMKNPVLDLISGFGRSLAI